MVEHVKLKVTPDDSYEWLIDEDTDEVIAEGPKIATEDVLWALGYKVTIEMDAPED